jgi:hypothetical protein
MAGRLRMGGGTHSIESILLLKTFFICYVRILLYLLLNCIIFLYLQQRRKKTNYKDK